MRGQVAILDVIMALFVISATSMLFINSQYTQNSPEKVYDTYFKISSDSLSFLLKTRIIDVINNPVIQELISQNYIKEEDYNRTLIDLLGTLWAEGNELSENLTQSLFSGFMPENINYEVLMGGQSIFMKNSTPATYLVRNKILVSGYMVGQPIHGYMARAWLERARGLETMSIPISPSGSGFGRFYFRGGDFVIERDFYVPDGAENISAYLDLSVHEEGGDVKVYVNGIEQFSVYSNSILYDRYNIYNISTGRNVLRIEMDRPWSYHCHTHPGIVLRVNYIKEKNLTYVEERNKTETIHLPYAEGSPATWMIFPFDVPKDSVINGAEFHFEGDGVNSRIEIWVNDQRIYLSTSPPSTPILNFDITPYLHQNSGNATGETNIISIYLDIRSDRDTYVWGARGTSIISNESYVFLNYTLPKARNYYGRIIHNAVIYFDELDGKGEDDIKKMYFNWTDFTIFSAFLNIVQRYSWKVAAAAWHEPETEPTWTGSDWSNYQIFKSLTGRAVPTRVYVPVDRFGYDTTNWVKARDFDGSSSNTILPNSSVELNFLVPSQVGYGGVFSNQTDAINDAINRLNQTIAGYVDSGDIETETTEIMDVPTMWGLKPLEVRIW